MDEQSTTSRRRRLITAAITVGIFFPVAVLVSALYWTASGRQVGSPQNIGDLIVIAVGWEGIVWAVLVFSLSLWLSRPGVFAIVVSSAALVSAAGQLIARGPYLSAAGSYSLLFIPGMLLPVALFTASALAAAIIARALTARATKSTLGSISVVALTLAVILCMSLPLQWASWYFYTGGERFIAPADGDRYLVTIVAIALLLMFAIVASAIRRSRLLLILAIGALLASAVIGFIFQVPEGRWWLDLHGSTPQHSTHAPCFGEGDPNCVGG
jgi:hypothetical protein